VIRIATAASLHCLSSVAGRTQPAAARKKMMSGSWKMSPQPAISQQANPTVLPTVSIGVITSPPNERRILRADGKSHFQPNQAPARNSPRWESRHESMREWHEIEWLTYVNTILAVVNTIQMGGHGGALLLAGMNSNLVQDESVKIKYELPSVYHHLRKHFIEFMNLRHQVGDMVYLVETKGKDAPTEQELHLTDCLLKDAQRRLAETCSFVGNLSGTDGALILRADLSVEGFGAEIFLDKVRRVKVYRVSDPLEGDVEELDSEGFGMRHRSAMRLCSTVPDLVAFVVSQDGGVSLVWNDKGEVCFKPGIKTTNVNMVLA